MLVRSSRHHASRPQRSAVRPTVNFRKVSVARRGYASPAVNPTTGTLQKIDETVWGRIDEISAQLKDIRSKGQKVSIDQYNEFLGANIVHGDIGGIVDAVEGLIKDNVTPNNTTIRLLNFFFGKTDNFIKGENLIEKLERLHNVPNKLYDDFKAAVPAPATRASPPTAAQAAKYGQITVLTDNNSGDLAAVYGAWHSGQRAKSATDKAALSKAISEAGKNMFAGDVGKQLAAQLGVEIIPDSAFEAGKDGKKVLKDQAWASKVQAKKAAVQARLAKSKGTLQGVAKFLAGQPNDAGAFQVNFAELLSFQRVFQNTHGELKKLFQTQRAVAVGNLILHGAPKLPDAHPWPVLFASSMVPVDKRAALAAEIKDGTFLNLNELTTNIIKPVLDSHERWFADYYVANDDLKTY